ncbi:MAG TPA: pectate lyase, partial [Bacteroides graminisolvens]|nr:pectate lyase [Bacteroides graminisolvens]
FYVQANYIDNTCNALTDKMRQYIAQTNEDNWVGIHPNTNNGALPGGSKDGIKANQEYKVAAVGTHTAATAYERVLNYAGASMQRDAVDTRIINEVKQGTYTYTGSNGGTNGLIDSQADCGGYPEYQQGSKPADTNKDGIADSWAAQNLPSGKTYKDIDKKSGYSYLELYINSLVAHIMKQGCEGSTASPCADDF